jgi:hypothetical protein
VEICSGIVLRTLHEHVQKLVPKRQSKLSEYSALWVARSQHNKPFHLMEKSQRLQLKDSQTNSAKTTQRDKVKHTREEEKNYIGLCFTDPISN